MSAARSLVLVLLIGLVSGCSALSSSNEAAWNAAPPPAGDRLQEGKIHFEQGNYALAVTAYRASLRDDSSSIRALNGLAASYDRLGRFDLSRRYYQRALEIDPNSAQTLNNMGYSLILEAMKNKGDPNLTAQARGYLQQASRSDGRHPSIIGNLSLVEAGPVPLTTPRELRKPLLALAEPDRYGAWVERRNNERQLLVTKPTRSMVADLRTSGARPAIVASSPISLVARAPAREAGSLRNPIVQVNAAKGPPQDSKDASDPSIVMVTTGQRALPLKQRPAAKTRAPWTLEARTQSDATVGLVSDRAKSPIAVVEARNPVAVDGPRVARDSSKSRSVVTKPPQDLLSSLKSTSAPPTADAEAPGGTGASEPIQLVVRQAAEVSPRRDVITPPARKAPRDLLANFAAGDVKPITPSTPRTVSQGRDQGSGSLPVQVASTEPLSLVTALDGGGEPVPQMPSVPVVSVRQASLSDLDPKASERERVTFKSVKVTSSPESLAATSAPLSLLAGPEDNSATTAPLSLLVAPGTGVATSAPLSLLAAPDSQTPAASGYLLEVSNGSERSGMAERFALYLEEQGVQVSRLSGTRSRGTGISTLRYREAYRAEAEDLLDVLPVAAVMIRDNTMDADVHLALGNDLLYFDTKRAAASRSN